LRWQWGRWRRRRRRWRPMEMAPGALPRPGRVPEQRLLSPKICLRWRQCCGTILGKTPIDLGFFVRRLFIGGEAASEGHQGASPPPGAARRGRATPWWACPLAPLRLSFGPRPSSGKNRSFGLRFVQFREYFLCSFSKTQK
jgi:hypothetical protein